MKTKTKAGQTHPFFLNCLGDRYLLVIDTEDGYKELWDLSDSGDSEFVCRTKDQYRSQGQILHDCDFADFVSLAVIQECYELAHFYDQDYLNKGKCLNDS